MKKRPEEKVDEDWMATYGDMVTLLLCFFVMISSVSKVDMAMFEQIQAGMNEGFGQKDVKRPIEMMMIELSEDVQSMSLGEEVALGTDSQGVVIEFGGDMLFAPGSAEIRPNMLPALKRLAATLMSDRYNSFNFSVEGHTSDEPLLNSQYPSNWELSAARAASIVRFLESRGIPRIRLRATGLYDNSPKYPNRDPYGEPIPQNMVKNRRVVIHVEPSFK